MIKITIFNCLKQDTNQGWVSKLYSEQIKRNKSKRKIQFEKGPFVAKVPEFTNLGTKGI